TMNVDTALSTGSLAIDRATLSGSGSINAGALSFAGTIQGSGLVTVTSGLGLGLTGSPSPILDGRSLTLSGGSGAWNTATTFTMRNGAVFTVGSGATFSINRSNGMTGGTFVVNGNFIAGNN